LERIETMQRDQMAISTEHLGRAFMSTRDVLEVVQPHQLAGSTPCASWEVRELINHFVGTARWAAAALLGTEVAEEDYAAGDYRARYSESMDEALAAFGSDAVERRVLLPFGEVSGAELMLIASGDQFAHGWDLARAIGLSTDLDPDLADELLVMARGTIPDEARGPDGLAPFGPTVRPGAGASSADRFAAFLGRSK
jgi:uncharacterized protein (TIGR03086 family)